LPSDWGEECVSLVQNFFETVLQAIGDGRDDDAKNLLRVLREPNETHLGLSRGQSQGRGLGYHSAVDVWEALSKSQAVQSGLLEDLEDTILMVPGISNDIISDIATNIIRAPLIAYTQETCGFYGIKLVSGVASGPLWNPHTRQWIQHFTSLPIAQGRKLILVPKSIVRQRMEYDPDEYYNQYILEYLRDVELSANSELVQLLRNRRRRVTKKSLREKYGTGKEAIVRETLKHPELLDQYRADKRSQGRPPLSHEEIAAQANAEEPDFEALIEAVRAVPPGAEGANDYHRAIENLLGPLFYPSLVNPRREFPIHQGRKRIDIQFTNAATSGFFAWLSRHQGAAAAYVPVECKNYLRELGNPEFDQLAGRFSTNRGRFGLLVYRAYEDKERYWASCLDTARDERGFIIPLDDEDMEKLVQERISRSWMTSFNYLHHLFERLIT